MRDLGRSHSLGLRDGRDCQHRNDANAVIRAGEFIRSEEQLWWPIVRQDAAEDPRRVLTK